MKVRAISFDFWNTLFEEQPGGFEFYHERRRALLHDAVREHRYIANEEIDRVCREEAKSHFLIWRTEQRTLPTSDRLDRILKKLGVALTDRARTRLIKAFEEGILERPPLPVAGARDVIEQLSRGYRLGLISDVGFSPGRVLKQVLSSHGLIGAFDSLIFSDEAGRSKPHAEVFSKTASALECEPGEIVHVGDLEPTDVVGAKMAGYFAVRFTGVTSLSDGESSAADSVTGNLYDLPGLVAMF